jgi:hypothetical protein
VVISGKAVGGPEVIVGMVAGKASEILFVVLAESGEGGALLVGRLA